jgi:hypothetical protein
MINALQQLADAGVAVWLDDLSRTQIQSGKLAKLAEHGGGHHQPDDFREGDRVWRRL